jgi:hypothetical protein
MLRAGLEQLQHERQATADEHRWVCEEIADHAGPTDLADDLDDRRQHRNRCDYDDDVANLPTVVLPAAPELAHGIITSL